MNPDPLTPQTANEIRWSREVEALHDVIEKLTHTNMALQIELARYQIRDAHRSESTSDNTLSSLVDTINKKQDT